MYLPFGRDIYNKSKKTQIIDLSHREPDVYIRLLELHTRIFRLVNSPAAALKKKLFVEPLLYREFYNGGCIKWSNSDIEHRLFVSINTGCYSLVPHLLSKLNVTVRH